MLKPLITLKTLAPTIMVEDVNRTAAFYRDVLGFDEIQILVFAELAIV